MIKNWLAETSSLARGYSGKNGLYVSVSPTSGTRTWLASLGRALGIGFDMDRMYKMHCTVTWSKSIPAIPRLADQKKIYQANANRIEYWSGHDGQGYVVLLLDSPALQALHKDWIDRGCTHGFPTYDPHVTLQDDIKLTDKLKSSIEAYNRVLLATPMTFINETLSDLKSS